MFNRQEETTHPCQDEDVEIGKRKDEVDIRNVNTRKHWFIVFTILHIFGLRFLPFFRTSGRKCFFKTPNLTVGKTILLEMKSDCMITSLTSNNYDYSCECNPVSVARSSQKFYFFSPSIIRMIFPIAALAVCALRCFAVPPCFESPFSNYKCIKYLN